VLEIILETSLMEPVVTTLDNYRVVEFPFLKTYRARVAILRLVTPRFAVVTPRFAVVTPRFAVVKRCSLNKCFALHRNPSPCRVTIFLAAVVKRCSLNKCFALHRNPSPCRITIFLNFA
jgi:hypothetical protein